MFFIKMAVLVANLNSHFYSNLARDSRALQTYANRLLYSRLILFTILSNIPSTRECTNRPLYEIREGTIFVIINILRIREGTGNAE